MGWNVIRKADFDDEIALEKAALRFCKRHNIKIDDDWPALTAVEFEVSERRELARLWRRIVRRTLNHPHAEGIAWGYVGYSFD